MSDERAKRPLKPWQKERVPVSIQAWRREVEGICRFLDRIQHYVKDEGDTWGEKVATYYLHRLSWLLNHPPHSQDEYRRRIFDRYLGEGAWRRFLNFQSSQT